MNARPARDMARLGLLAGTAVILAVMENQVPRPLPWMRLGLGNLPVLVALLTFGFGPAFGVSVVKVLLGGFLGGGLGGPASIMGMVAGGASVTTMGAACRWSGGCFSAVGVSIIGAVTHQLAQLGVASAYMGHTAVLSLLPLAMLSGLLSGGIIGLLAEWSRRRLTGGEARPVHA